jgi:hypothetical protein
MGTKRIYELLNRALDIASGIHYGDLLESLKATTLEIERTDGSLLSKAILEDLGIYARRYFPKKRYSLDEQRAFTALNASLERLGQRRAVLHDLVGQNDTTNPRHEG